VVPATDPAGAGGRAAEEEEAPFGALEGVGLQQARRPGRFQRLRDGPFRQRGLPRAGVPPFPQTRPPAVRFFCVQARQDPRARLAPHHRPRGGRRRRPEAGREPLHPAAPGLRGTGEAEILEAFVHLGVDEASERRREPLQDPRGEALRFFVARDDVRRHEDVVGVLHPPSRRPRRVGDDEVAARGAEVVHPVVGDVELFEEDFEEVLEERLGFSPLAAEGLGRFGGRARRRHRLAQQQLQVGVRFGALLSQAPFRFPFQRVDLRARRVDVELEPLRGVAEDDLVEAALFFRPAILPAPEIRPRLEDCELLSDFIADDDACPQLRRVIVGFSDLRRGTFGPPPEVRVHRRGPARAWGVHWDRGPRARWFDPPPRDISFEAGARDG